MSTAADVALPAGATAAATPIQRAEDSYDGALSSFLSTRRVGPLDQAGVEEVLAQLPQLRVWPALTGKRPRGTTQLRAARHVLEWLRAHPGEGWQQRWQNSGADTGLDWLEQLTETMGTARPREKLVKGLRCLLLARVVLPSYGFLNAYRATTLLTHARAELDPDGFAQLERAGHDNGVGGYALMNGMKLLAKACLHTGKNLRELTGADLTQLRDWALDNVVRDAYYAPLAWDLLATLVPLHGPRLEPWHRLRRGQRSPAQLIDRYRLACRPVRDLLVRYLAERQQSLDHSSLISLANVLGSVFWADLEAHHPGIDSLHLPREVIVAWMQRLSQVPLRSGRTRAGTYQMDVLVNVRALYLDIAEWAIEDPSWVAWVAPCPIHRRDLAGRKKHRAAGQAKMHQRVRDRLPHLPQLADAAHQQHRRWDEVLAAARESPIDGEFTAAGNRWRRILRPGWTRRQAAHETVAARAVIATDLASGEIADVRHREEQAFWAWAIIETLRHTGIRLEELLELTELALISYRLPARAGETPTITGATSTGGEVVPLLQIVPSKNAEERLLLVSPELASVLASILTRLRRDSGGRVPLVAQWDVHERVFTPPMPYLFQRRRGPTRHATFSRGSVSRLINKTVAAAGLRDRDGDPLVFTPHDFRRMFATDAVTGGLPVHIAARLLGHHNLATTQAYLAVFQDDLVRAYRGYLQRRRELRPPAEYREPTAEEWAEFEAHFERRKLELGTCGRPYGTPCQHEHACIRCPMLRVDPSQRQRLVEILRNLADRIDEAQVHGWLGEIEGLKTSLAAGRAKLAALERARTPGATVTDLGIPLGPGQGGAR